MAEEELTWRELADIVGDECFRRAEVERLERKKVRLKLEV